MTRLHDPASSPLRLRADSERALRRLRLVWLLGWPTDKIAGWLGVRRATVCRRLKRYGLRAAEADGETAHLIACELRDRTGDAVLNGDDLLAKELLAMQSKHNSGLRPKAPVSGT